MNVLLLHCGEKKILKNASKKLKSNSYTILL